MPQDLLRAVAFALGGEDVGAQPSLDHATAHELERRLTELGLGRAQLGARRRQRLAAEQPWPWSVPQRLRGGIPAAQLLALCTDTTEAMQLRTLRLHAEDTALTPADLRLLADRPPHWG